MKIYQVIYRKGGTLNFVWHKCQATYSQKTAEKMKADLIRAGYPAMIHDYHKLQAIGLPETYEY